MMIEISPTGLGRQVAWINASNQPCAKVGAETANVAIIVENRRSCKGDGATSPKTAKEVWGGTPVLWKFTAFQPNSALFA